MRVVPLLLVLLALPASAAGNDPGQPPPSPILGERTDREMNYEEDGFEGEWLVAPLTVVTFRYDGCWSPYSSDYIRYDADVCEESGDMQITKRGSDRHYGVTENDDEDGIRKELRWQCKRAGTYDYRVHYGNDSYSTAEGDYVKTYRGTFKIPKCKRPALRTMTLGRAAEEVADQFEDYVSSVRCSAVFKSGVWRCTVIHNNSYRECTDTDTYTFYGRDKWGRAVTKVSVRDGPRRCRYF